MHMSIHSHFFNTDVWIAQSVGGVTVRLRLPDSATRVSSVYIRLPDDRSDQANFTTPERVRVFLSNNSHGYALKKLFREITLNKPLLKRG